MMVTVAGTPSPLTYWTLHAVRILIHTLCSDHTQIHAFYPDDVRSLWSTLCERPEHTIVVFADCPNSAFCEFILSTGSPVIFIAEDVEETVSYVVAAHGMKPEHALRLFSQCATSLWNFSGAEQVWEVARDCFYQRVDEYIQNIARHYRFVVDKAQNEQVLSRLIANIHDAPDMRVGDEVVRFIKHARWPGNYDVLEEKSSDLVRQVGSQYASLLKGQPLDRVIWPREIFPNVDKPEEFLRGPQSLIGRARYLLVGPYFH